MYERETQIEAPPDFETGLATILDRPLTVEGIDIYADSALEDVICLVQTVVMHYEHAPTYTSDIGANLEDAAFKYFRLDNIEIVLNHLAAKADEINKLDEIIKNAQSADEIIIPPDSNVFPITEGEGYFESEEVVPKLKTLLFILSNEFEVDLEDEEQLRMVRGPVHENMVRKESYYLVEIPALNRLVLICDQLGNATYVLNRKLLGELDINLEQLLEYGKSTINLLLERDSKLGLRLTYRKKFINNLVRALEGEGFETNNKGRTNVGEGRYLVPNPPKGYLHEYGVSLRFGVNNHVIHKAVEELGDILGETQKYKAARSRGTVYYSPEQQELIRLRLEERGVLSEPAPEGYKSLTTFARANKVGYQTVLNSIEKIGDELEVKTYKFGGTPALGLSPEQQGRVIQQLEADEYLTDRAPEGILSVGGLVKIINGAGESIISNAINELGASLGKVKKYKFGRSVIAFGFNEEQQALIIERLQQNGSLSPQAPVGYLSIKGMSKEWGITEKAIGAACDILTEELGEIGVYKFSNNITFGFSLAQQENLKQYLADKGHIAAPKGYRPIRQIADDLGISFTTVEKAIHALEDSLGEIQKFRFGSQVTQGYSEKQQDVIIEYLSESGVLAAPAPDGYLSINRLAGEIGIHYYKVARAIDELVEEGLLGEVKTYKFNIRSAKGLSPQQQELIKQRLSIQEK